MEKIQNVSSELKSSQVLSEAIFITGLQKEIVLGELDSQFLSMFRLCYEVAHFRASGFYNLIHKMRLYEKHST